MSIRGPGPKEDRVRRNKLTYEEVAIQVPEELKGFPLPSVKMEDKYGSPYVFEWHSRTLEWWEKWRKSPQAAVMEDSDWEGLLECAVLHSTFWNGGLKPTELANLSAQISRRVAAYGATFEDRRKLRMSIKSGSLLESPENEDAIEEVYDYVSALLGNPI